MLSCAVINSDSWCPLLIFSSINSFPSLEAVWLFPDFGSSVASVVFFSPCSHNEHGTIFYANFQSYMLSIYFDGLYLSLQFFIIFYEELHVVHVHKAIKLSCDLENVLSQSICIKLSGPVAITNCSGENNTPW